MESKAGGHYAADFVLQLPTRGSGSVACHSALMSSTEHLLGVIARESQVTILRYDQANESA